MSKKNLYRKKINIYKWAKKNRYGKNKKRIRASGLPFDRV